MKGLYAGEDNLQVYINKIKTNLKIKNKISVFVDDEIQYNDEFVIGLIYVLKDTRHNLQYIGSEQIANGSRQKMHISRALYIYNKRQKLNKLQKHIIKYKNELDIFVDESIEIVVYKNIDGLFKREQNYINLYDTKLNGLNTMNAKIFHLTEQYNRERQSTYNTNNKYFRKYGRRLIAFKGKMNELFKTNQSYDFYKNIIEQKPILIKKFINLYCYEEYEDPELYNILLNYILYKQKQQNIKYYYEDGNDNDNDNGNDNDNDNDNIIIDFVDNSNYIKGDVNANDTVIIDII